MNLDAITATLFESLNNAWMHDVPFILVPSAIVAGFRGQNFTAIEFYNSEIWKEPNHWNAGYIHDHKMVIFMYGHFNSLEKYLYCERIGADPDFQAYGTKVWEIAIQEGERIAQVKGMKYIWTRGFRKGEVRKFMQASDGARIPDNEYIIRKDFK